MLLIFVSDIPFDFLNELTGRLDFFFYFILFHINGAIIISIFT